MTPYPDEISIKKQINDNVHVFIELTDLETKVVDSPYFQRLRQLKQLSLLEYVFPGAIHNRFSHSLGVMHIADKMVVQLQKQGHLKGLRELLRMTALLHDIGHYPLSHLVEYVVKTDANECISSLSCENIPVIENADEKHGINGCEEKKNIVQKAIDESASHKLNREFHHGKKHYAHHERMASLVIHKTPLYDILSDKFSVEDLKMMSQIIHGTYVSEGPESLIIHSELDADRFDYLLRDSKQTGVIYGLFDMDQIIRNLSYIEDADQNMGRLVVNKKAMKAVEHYMMCRYFLYSTVVYHKASIGFEIMAQKVYEGLMERNLVYSYFDIIKFFDSFDDEKKYLNYNDSYFFDIMHKFYNGTLTPQNISEPSISDKALREMISNVLYRKPLKMVFEDTKLVDRNEKPQRSVVFNKMFHEKISGDPYNIEAEWQIPFNITVTPSNISPHVNFNHKYENSVNDEMIRILSIDKDGKHQTKSIVEDPASLMYVIGNYQLHIDRFYTKDESYAVQFNNARRAAGIE